MSLGILSFLTPLPLLGLLALPVIWWLLRTTPPSPNRQQFPPTRILKKLLQDEKTSAHSPWWLTLLRLVAAALVILALSQPVLNSAAPLLSATKVSTTGPLVVMVDNGWAAANQWERRKAMMQRVIREAQAQQRLVYLVPTAPDQGAFTVSPMSAVDAMTTVERMEPTPFFTDRKVALEKLDEALAEAQGDATTDTGGALFYLSNGLASGEEEELARQLKGFESRGMKTHVVTPLDEDLPLGLRARLGKGGALFAEVIGTASGQPRAGDVVALSAREEVLGRVAFTLPANTSLVEAKIDLPLELRNQIAKLRIEGQRSAGAVYLLDQRSSWRRIGLISNESGQLAQPLLSPLYYIRRALEPYAEIVSGGSEDVAETTARFTERNVSVIVMADIGRLIGAPLLRLTDWVEKGGVLVRFAGPHMEESQDSLLPTPLRQGGRRLGGALSWAKPQPLAAFDDASPFAGLDVPDDVVVTRQLLADPSRMRDKVHIWARLQDGTPLVTASREVDGWVVLVHVTANSDWSNLPLSGLFVDMLRRLSQLSVAPVGGVENRSSENGAAGDDALSRETATASDADEDVSNDELATLLAPYRMLNGFGTLGKPAAVVEPIAFKSLGSVDIGPTHPPGFYGPAAQTVALNLLNEDSNLQKADYAATGAEQLSYRKAVERALRAPLFLTALILLLVDSLIVLALRGVFSLRGARARAAVFALVALPVAGLAMVGANPASAQEITPFDMKDFKTFDPKSVSPESLAPGFLDPRAVKPKSLDRQSMDPKLTAALDTHLAYVITGDSKVDQTSRDGLRGLTYTLNSRTAVEPAEPVGVRIESDELAFFPILYWPVGSYTNALSDESVVRVNTYMKQGGMIIFDTKDQDSRIGGLTGSGQKALEALLSRLDIPRLEPVPNDHVLTKSFYLLSSFPGRYQGGALWVEAAAKRSASSKERTSEIDGVTTLMITSNDFASAWAVDQSYQPLYPVVPGGRLQREMAYRVGVNIVMYALAGNYKADQVHVPALLERLGQ